MHAAIHALNAWAGGGGAPAIVPRLDMDDAGIDLLLDDLGNVTGGWRTFYVDAPAAVLSGIGQEGNAFCFLFGTTALLDAAQMAARYTDKAGYTAAVHRTVDEGIEAGTLLAADGERTVQAAELQWDSLDN